MGIGIKALRLALLLVLVAGSILGLPEAPPVSSRGATAALAGKLLPDRPGGSDRRPAAAAHPAGPPAPAAVSGATAAGGRPADSAAPPAGGAVQDYPLPLPHECGGSTGGPCCAYGYVYLGAAPAAGVTVRIANSQGVTETMTASGEYSPIPYYAVNLSAPPLSATVGAVLTITAVYSGASATRTWTVLAEGQQVDLALAVVPTPRQSNWVYDEARGRFVLFGGLDNFGRLGDTWEYDGAHWQRVDTPDAPTPRSAYGLAYDSARQRVILFGGTPGGRAVLNDTWEYDGANWTHVLTTHAPSPRSSLGMTYDAARQRVVLFGGTDEPGDSHLVFHDTWTYDGTDWSQQIFLTDPPGRILDGAMVYDAQRQRVLFHAGWIGDGCDNATWEYDGANWTQVATGPVRYAQTMTYDSGRGRVLMYDGSDCTQGMWDTWEYDPTAAQWTMVATPHPTARAAPLVYDPAGARVLLFGGYAAAGPALGELWQFPADTQQWELVLPSGDVTPTWVRQTGAGTPAARSAFAFAYDGGRGQLLLYGGRYDFPPGGCSAETWALDGLTWTLALTTGPAARADAGLAYDPAQQRLVLFGGSVGCDPAVVSGETWQYDPAGPSWTQLLPAANPTPRSRPQLAYDGGRGRLVLFGGWDGSAYLGDTWEFVGGDWVPVATPHAPPARAGGRMVYAADRDVLLLVGGEDAAGSMDDAWAYDGGDWTAIASPPAGAPAGAGLAYDTDRGRLVLYGGALPGTWEYDGQSWQPIAVHAAPAARLCAAVVYDAARQRTLLYGGTDGTVSYTDTWAYQPGTLLQADFAAQSRRYGAVPLDVQFVDRSTGHSSWRWNLGDGHVSGARHPFYTYAHTGTYTVSLAVDGPAGTAVMTRSHYITVTPSTLPAARIVLLGPDPAMQGVDDVYFEGYGIDTDDEGCCIKAGRLWSSLDKLLLSSTIDSYLTLTIPAISLTAGLHVITFTVVDEEGEAAPPDIFMLTVVPYAATQARTLIVTNEQRLAALYGTEQAAAVVGRLSTLAAHPAVSGTILLLEQDPRVAAAYAAWDAAPTSTAAANAVAAAIKALVDEVWDANPRLAYLVIAGDDRVVPFRRVLDQTHWPESCYGLVPMTTTVGAALHDDMTLTDNYYADRVPTVPAAPGWDGHDLYLPDLGVGRLVETPAEIMSQVDAFLAAPQRALSDTVVTGYGYVADGATAICERLEGDGIAANCALVGPGWGRDEWITQALTASRDLVSFNSHDQHDLLGTPAAGVVRAADIVSAAAGLSGLLFYGPGCHAGLNVAASTVGTLDIPQAAARREALLVGNTGYGWAGLYTVALSERLMLEFTGYLVRMRLADVGRALSTAKHAYYLTEPTFDYYDEKVVLESTLYGLPMAVYASPAGVGGGSLPRPAAVQEAVAWREDGLAVTTMTYQLAPLVETVTAVGRYYSYAGQAAAEYRQAIQPLYVDDTIARLVFPHGILLRSAVYSDIAGFDPVIAPAITETAALTEAVLLGSGWFPAQVVQLNRQDAGSRLLVLLGQYDPATEVERLYRRLSVEVYYHPTATDWLAPQVWGIASTAVGGTATVQVRAADPAGIAGVVVAYTAGEGTWASVALAPHGGLWSGAFPAPPGTSFFVQAVDGAGNVAASDNAGQYYRPGEGTWRAYLPLVRRP